MAVTSTDDQLALGLHLDPGRRFDSYFAGPNRVAVALLRAMGEAGGEQQAFLWGPRGRGKSHLLQAACVDAGGRGLRATYLAAERPGFDWTRGFEGLESLHLVCLDDVQHLLTGAQAELALFDLINRLRASGTGLVISADCAPAELRPQLPDLLSRLHWGPVIQLQPLDDADSAAALQMRARHLGLHLSDEVAAYMLNRYPRDLPGLLARLDRLDRASLQAQRALTKPFVRQVLG